MAKITPVLWTQKKNKKGLAPIYLRIEASDRRRYVSLRTYVRESHWNNNSRSVRKNHPQHEAINNLIAQRISEAQSEILKMRTDREAITAEGLKETLAPETPESRDFFAFADTVIDDFERRGKLYTHKRYKSIAGKFKAFTGSPLPFDKITPRLLRSFETHLIEHYGNKPNTVASNFRAIRAILYRAIREGLFTQAQNPFFQFKVRQPRGKREKLSMEDLQAIESLALESGSLIWHVRNYFLFSFYCAGVRFGDMAKMKRENIKANGNALRLEYQMSKTGTSKSLKLLPQASTILGYYTSPEGAVSDYLFPILVGYDISTPRKLLNAISSQNALINKYLKIVAKRAGIQCKLSFHISRHSFADIARQKGWDVYLISKALGHSSIKVTENYLKGFDAEALDKEMESLFEQ